MEAWLADPQLLEADKGAKYSAEIRINMDDIKVKGTVCCCGLAFGGQRC
jgi:aconitase B